MKMQLSALLLALPLVALAADPESPINKVVTFIEELKAEVTEDFKAENASWDKYKKWAEDTIALATKNIAEEEEIIEKATAKIEEMSGGKASSGAEIENAEKELKENEERTEESTSVYNKEKKEHEAAKNELDDSIAALKAAKAELDKGHDKIVENKEESEEEQAAIEKQNRDALKAQEDKNAAFIQTGRALQNAMKKLLAQPLVNQKLSSADLAVLQSLAKSPSKKQGFLQVDGPDTNGDYQESGGAAMGIIDTTLEEFEGDLRTTTEEHAGRTTKFDALITELTKEKTDLKKFLGEQKSSNGESGKTLSEKKALKHDTQEELAANEKLKMNTEDSLKEKTYQYDNRVKLRLQEMEGIDQAIGILTSDDAKATFKGAAKVNFLQMAREQTEQQGVARTKAYKVLQEISAQYHDLQLAQLAVRVKTAGHFDKVIDRIDGQIKHLHAEEQEDVEHRDRCQGQQADNEAEIATLTDTAAKAGTLVTRLKEEANEMKSDLEELRTEITENTDDMNDSEEERKEERAEHLAALKHDKEALALLEDAIVSIKAFYKDNTIAVLQQNAAPSEPDKTAPELGFDSKNYGGGKDSTKGLIGMMDMVREDMVNEIKQGKADDKKNQELFEKERETLTELLDKQKKNELASVKALAEKEGETSDKEDFKADTEASLEDANKEKESLSKDCAWVKTNFASRREKRKTEIEGLVEAKGLLAGASA